jgi:flagellar protein FlaG
MEINGLNSIKTDTFNVQSNENEQQTTEVKNTVATIDTNRHLSEKETIKLIEDANKKLIGSNTAVEYSIHDKTHEIMIKIIDRDTDEIIREIPSEKILDLVATFCEMAGILVDEKI